MTIAIIEERFIQSIDTSLDITRHADIVISDGTNHYQLGVGGLPRIGNLQSILDAREAELWHTAQEKDNQLTIREVRRLLYNSILGGGWTSDDYQEATFEKDDGNSTKWDILKARRATIQAEWQNSY